MANALPILLIGGAAALMLAGKKKKVVVPTMGELRLEPTTPPPLPKAVKISGSGYPGVTRERMQEIQTMLVANGYDVGSYGLDGKYGPATKQAVWEFQEDWGGLTVDGKPGPKTQAALEEAEAARIQAQQYAAQQQPQKEAQVVDECDPLNPGTWGTGNICVLSDNRWVRQRAQAVAPDSPPVSKEHGCAPEKKQTILPGGTGKAKSWYFCNFGQRILLDDFLGSKVSLTVKPAGAAIPTYSHGHTSQYGVISDSADIFLGWRGDYLSDVGGRLIAIMREVAVATGERIGFTIDGTYGTDDGHITLVTGYNKWEDLAIDVNLKPKLIEFAKSLA
jgi:peptidoglycan hydrolase-like protein with peptidoglycan-binding domain